MRAGVVASGLGFALCLVTSTAHASVSVVMIPIPYVQLNSDPCDAFGACGEPIEPEGLTPEEEALLGCGPYWGTDCETDGIDLTRADMSVLLQSWPGFDGAPDPPEPCDPTAEPGGLVVPFPSCDRVPGGIRFGSELAAISWNFLMMTVAQSQPPEGEAPYSESLDLTDPMSTEPAQCSFAQPQYCSSVIAFLQTVPEPSTTLASVTALLIIALAARKHRRTPRH
jgi:hypothetical protein